MKLKNTNGVKPLRDGVLVDVHEVAKEKDGIYLGSKESTPTDINMYFGTVEEVGPKSTESTACPGLKKGDIGFFSEFSGYHIAASEETTKKLIPAYDIMAIITDTKNLNETTVKPTADRYLVEVKFVDQNDEGLVLSDDDAKDPKLLDLDYGVLVKGGPVTTSGLKLDSVVAFDPNSGEVVRKAEGIDTPELRLIREDDILIVIE